jgi:hypothetical protein
MKDTLLKLHGLKYVLKYKHKYKVIIVIINNNNKYNFQIQYLTFVHWFKNFCNTSFAMYLPGVGQKSARNVQEAYYLYNMTLIRLYLFVGFVSVSN